jgi:hypothetical protein
VTLSSEDIAARHEQTYPGAPVRILDVDEVVEGDLVVVLADLQSDTAEPFLWVTVFQRYSNGWFDAFASEGDDFVYTQPMGTTIAVRSGVAPEDAKRCRVELFGQVREREIKTQGYFLVGFFSADGREVVSVPPVMFLS